MKLNELKKAVDVKLADSDLSRLSLKSDGEEAFDVAAKAFLEDPMMVWVAGLKDNDDPKSKEIMYNLNCYLHKWISRKHLTGSRGVTLGIKDKNDEILTGCMSIVPSSCHKERVIDILSSMYYCGFPPMYGKSKGDYCPNSAKRLEALNCLTAKRVRHMKDTKNWIYLQSIGVHPEHQGKGNGKKMLMWLNEVSTSLNNASIYLETESKVNESIYKKFGFRTLEEVDVSVPGDPSILKMWLMRRDN